MTAHPVLATLEVCTTCRGRDDDRPGVALLEAVRGPLAAAGIAARPVECLAVCRRPATVALTAPGHWTYVIGDVDPATDAEDLVDGAVRYARSDTGIVPWRERPACLRRGIVARVPPPATAATSEEIPS